MQRVKIVDFEKSKVLKRNTLDSTALLPAVITVTTGAKTAKAPIHSEDWTENDCLNESLHMHKRKDDCA